MDYLDIKMPEGEIGKLSNLALAHVGDGVYELMVRTCLASNGSETAKNLHKNAVRLVAAPAQARAAEKLLPMLSEAEQEVYRRGRNAHVNAIPKAASVREYHEATGLEALFGWLYLSGMHGRLNELFELCMEAGNGA